MPSALGPRGDQSGGGRLPVMAQAGPAVPGRTGVSAGGREVHGACSHTSCRHGGSPKGGGS